MSFLRIGPRALGLLALAAAIGRADPPPTAGEAVPPELPETTEEDPLGTFSAEIVEGLRGVDLALSEEAWDLAVKRLRGLLDVAEGTMMADPSDPGRILTGRRRILDRFRTLPRPAREADRARNGAATARAAAEAGRRRDPDRLAAIGRDGVMLESGRDALRDAARLYMERGRPAEAARCLEAVAAHGTPTDADLRLLLTCHRFLDERVREARLRDRTGIEQDGRIPAPVATRTSLSRPSLPEGDFGRFGIVRRFLFPEVGSPNGFGGPVPVRTIEGMRGRELRTEDLPAGDVVLAGDVPFAAGPWGGIAWNATSGERDWSYPGGRGGPPDPREMFYERDPAARDPGGKVVYVVRAAGDRDFRPWRSPNPLGGRTFCQPYGELAALDIASGATRWSVRGADLGLWFLGGPSADRNGVVVGAVDPDIRSTFLLEFDPETGALRHRVPIGPERHQPALFAIRLEGRWLYAATSLGTVAAVDRIWGEVLWQRVYPRDDLRQGGFAVRRYGDFQMQRGDPAAYGWMPTPPERAGDLLLVAPIDADSLLGIDPIDGTIRWTRERRSRGVPMHLLGVCDAGAIAVTDAVVAIDPTDGAERQRSLPLPPVTGRGILFREATWIPTEAGVVEVAHRGGIVRRVIPFPEGIVPGNLQWDGKRLWSRTIAGLDLLVPEPGSVEAATLPEGLSEAARENLDRLADPDPSVREAAEADLARSEDPADPLLERIVATHPPGEAAWRAARALRTRGRLWAVRRIDEILSEAIDEDLTPVFDRFLEESPAARAAAASALLDRIPPERIVEGAGPLLDDPADGVRVAAARSLAESSDEARIPLLVRVSEDADTAVREIGVNALRRIPGEAAWRALLAVLQRGEPDMAIRFSAADGLGNRSDIPDEALGEAMLILPDHLVLSTIRGMRHRDRRRPALDPYFIRILGMDGVNAGVKQEVILHFADARVDAAIPAIREALADPRGLRTYRYGAAIALAEFRATEGVEETVREQLREILDSRLDGIYERATLALGSMGDRAAVPGLLNALRNAMENPDRFARIRGMLADLTGHRVESGDPESIRNGWFAWWEAHGAEFTGDEE